MQIAKLSIVSQNITLLYDTLDLRNIDGARLKHIIGNEAVVMDTPDVILAVFPPSTLVVHLGDRRVSVSLQQEAPRVGSTPIWEVAARCHQLVPGDCTLAAYGYNYDLQVALSEGDATSTIRELFLPDPSRVEAAVAGRVTSVIPRVRYSRAHKAYDLIVEPTGEREIHAHVNVHFQAERLPDSEALATSYADESAYVLAALPMVLGGDKAC